MSSFIFDGTGTTTPDTSALLEVNTTVKGLLPPRMTTTQRDAIPSPATGLEIFNTTQNEPQFFDGTNWIDIGATAPAGLNEQVQFNDNGSFGANDEFVFDGFKVGIGTDTPTAKVSIVEDIFILDDWILRTPSNDFNWQEVIFVGGQFVAVANIGSINRVMTSPDGITWTARTAASLANWSGITFGAGLFVAVGGSNLGPAFDIMTSPDAITWTNRTAPLTNIWESVTFGAGVFVAVTGSSQNIIRSTDGITWTSESAAEFNAWQSVTFGAGLFVAVAFNGTNRVMTSPDGITWTSQSAATNDQWINVKFVNNLFVATSFTTPGNTFMTSPDGINWTTRVHPAPTVAWSGIGFGNGAFIVTAISGTGNRCMTSTDAITWELKATPADNNWSSVAFDNTLIRFAAVAGSGTDRAMTLAFAEPDSAVLKLDSTSSGFLPPRMTTTQRDDIDTPATGLEIYNITVNEPQYFNGTIWSDIAGAESLTEVLAIGNTTGGNDIEISSGDSIITPTSTVGGNLGIALGIGTTGLGGTLSLRAGDGSTGGGAVTIKAGNALDGDVIGQSVTITGGDARDEFGNDDDGGNVVLQGGGNDGGGGSIGKIVLQPNGGFVGIGTTDPDTVLRVFENTGGTGLSTGIRISQNGAGDAVLHFDRAVTEFYSIGYDNSAGQFRISAGQALNDDPRLVINDTVGNIGIGSTSPDLSALLDLASTSQGLLPPRMTTVERDAIPSPATGLMIFNITSLQTEVFDGTAWRSIGKSGVNVFGFVNGNAATTPITDGTYDTIAVNGFANNGTFASFTLTTPNKAIYTYNDPAEFNGTMTANLSATKNVTSDNYRFAISINGAIPVFVSAVYAAMLADTSKEQISFTLPVQFVQNDTIQIMVAGDNTSDNLTITDLLLTIQ